MHKIRKKEKRDLLPEVKVVGKHELLEPNSRWSSIWSPNFVTFVHFCGYHSGALSLALFSAQPLSPCEQSPLA
jgi:hypothetical protein